VAVKNFNRKNAIVNKLIYHQKKGFLYHQVLEKQIYLSNFKFIERVFFFFLGAGLAVMPLFFLF
jgi:hypothetical protein